MSVIAQVGRSVEGDLLAVGNAFIGTIEVGILKRAGRKGVSHLLGAGGQGEHGGGGMGGVMDLLSLPLPAAAGTAKAVVGGRQLQVWEISLAELLYAVLTAVVVVIVIAIHLTHRRAVGEAVAAALVADHIAGQGLKAHQGRVLAADILGQVQVLRGQTQLRRRGGHIQYPVSAGVALGRGVIPQRHQQHFGKGRAGKGLLGIKAAAAVSGQDVVFHAVGDAGGGPAACRHVGEALGPSVKLFGLLQAAQHGAEDLGCLLPGQGGVGAEGVAAALKYPQGSHYVHRLGVGDLVTVHKIAAGRRGGQGQQPGQGQRRQGQRQHPFPCSHGAFLLQGSWKGAECS